MNLILILSLNYKDFVVFYIGLSLSPGLKPDFFGLCVCLCVCLCLFVCVCVFVCVIDSKQ